MPLIQGSKKDGGSPAAELHTEYNSFAPGRSKVADWRELIKLIGVRDCRIIVRHLRETSIHPPTTGTIKTNWRRYYEDAIIDPVACQYPVSIAANELAEKLVYSGSEALEPEYVAQAIDTYAAILDTTATTCPILWVKLDCVYGFVRRWFEDIAVFGTSRMRQLRLSHPKLKQELCAVARGVGVPESTVEEILEKTKAKIK